MAHVRESHRFGPHRVDVVEYPDDEGSAFFEVVIDGVIVTDPPLLLAPSLEEVVRVYAAWREGQPAR